MPAPTLDGRLLCVSGAAYAITGNQQPLAPDPANVYLGGAGFKRPPTMLQGGVRDINACLVGEIDDGIVIALRGTLEFDIHRIPSLVDWFNDFNAKPTPAQGFPGQVHSGFLSAVQILSAEVMTELQAQRVGDAAGKPVLITGHSKGGAAASLIAWQLQAAGIGPLKVVTFAAAKPGDSAFRDAYNAAVPDHTRYEFGNDIVPYLPPDKTLVDTLSSGLGLLGQLLPGLARLQTLLASVPKFDYQQVGTLQYINDAHEIQGASDELTKARRNELLLDLLHGNFGDIKAAHSIGCNSGYMQGVAPTGVCNGAVA